MKILITTPAGTIGRRIVPELLAPEFSVRVMARNPARLPTEFREQVEAVRGSTDDPKALCKALEGIDALFWSVPRAPIRETNIHSYYERFARAASQAIREAATPRVVTFSGVPASALHAVEDILNESGAAIRHLRCGWITENPSAQGNSIWRHGLSFPLLAQIPGPMTALADIADAALRLLARTDWDGVESLSVHGPDNLSSDRVAALIESIF
jgi:uncharacterized protein YbjT (DUF2867 family)